METGGLRWITEYKNPDGSTALAAVKHFSVKVKNGVLHGEIGTRGAADWYELNGTIAADGAAPSFRPPSVESPERKWIRTPSARGSDRKQDRVDLPSRNRFAVLVLQIRES
jgi:hypothetical protein